MRFVRLSPFSAKGWGAGLSLELHALLPLIFVTALLPSSARGQTAGSESQARTVADAIRRVQENDLGTGPVDALSYVRLIADARAVQALPALEQYYARTSDPEIRAGVASALVRMGDKNDDYWNYLVQLATPAAESDAPYPLDEHAGKDNGFISTEFKIWASNHNLSVEAAMKVVMLDLPSGFSPLAQTGDPRGVPLLRKALMSPNILIAGLAAAGLAQAQDKDSIPMIIDACKRATPMMAPFFADSLLFFDDPEAQRTFTSYFPGINIQEARKFRHNSPFARSADPN
jgi:HEAT repeat protein